MAGSVFSHTRSRSGDCPNGQLFRWLVCPRLVDLSPGEQVAALRRGELDVVVLANTNAAIGREFYVRRIATLPAVLALPETHPLAAREGVALADLRGELFVKANPHDIPGYHHWVIQLCRRAGFRPKFVENATSLSHQLSTLVAENGVAVLPELVTQLKVPGVTFRPLHSPVVKCELQVAWQRGDRGAGPRSRESPDADARRRVGGSPSVIRVSNATINP